MKKGCESNFTSPDVIIGPSPYGLFAKTSMSQGYSYIFCVKCEITPLLLEPIYFTKDYVNITQKEVDCSSSLVDANFPNPKTLIYSSK